MSYDATCSDIIYTWCWYNLCLCCFVRHKTCVSQAVGNRLHWCMQFSSMLYKMWCIMWGRTSEKRNRNNTLHNRSNTTETAHNTKSFYTHPLPFRSIAVCIGVRTLHLSRHPASVFAPYRFPLRLATLSCSACYTYRCQWRCSAALAVRKS